jgi:hypothetical protein
MKSVIAALMLWISAHTNYQMNFDSPRIVQLSQTALEQKFYQGQDKDSHLHAFYDPKNEIVYINNKFDINDPFNQSILLHEILHHVQFKNGVKYDCIGELEEEAYTLQKQYLREVHNFLWEYDALYLKIITSCNKSMY